MSPPVNRGELALTSALWILRDSDADATAEANVGPGAVTLYLIEINNANNATTAVYLKCYNATSVTVGTTVPDIILRAAGGATVSVAIPEGIVFGTGLSVACTTEAGTAGTTSPASDVVVTIVFSQP